MSINLDPTGNALAPTDTGRPGMGGIGEGEVIVPRQPRRVPTQAILLVLVVSVSAAALYAMRQMGLKSGFTFDTVEVNYKEADSEKARTYERIMADLARVQKPLDVTLNTFGKSPFMLDTKDVSITPAAKPFESAVTDAERHRAEAVAALKAMHLHSIVGGMARLDDQTVTAGDTLGLFTVKAVGGRSVTFSAYGEEFCLTMENNKPTGPKKAPTRMHPVGGPGSPR